ncbi:MAG: DUF4838 domain-containing protein [Clostridiales bacterium]|jgi:hypothetical protein|nr:DUF4838 domain-containing protein [Clostridiales bacterium]
MDYLAKDGKTDYKIVIPRRCPPAVKYAAGEVRAFVRKSAGAALPIVRDGGVSLSDGGRYFSIGRTRLLAEARLGTEYPALNGDGFVLKTIDGSVITDAAGDRGFLFAAYEFLERFVGARFFAYDETYVPKRREIPMPPTDILSVSPFRMRAYPTPPTFYHALDEAHVARTRTVHNFFPIRPKYGGGPFIAYGRGGGTHNAHFYVPAEKYGTKESTGWTGEWAPDHEPHPEFYHTYLSHPALQPALAKGWDGPYWDADMFGPSIDYANGITPDGKLDESKKASVAKAVIEELKKDVLAHPKAEYFVVDQEDAAEPVFDPELLKKYTASGVLIRFFNVVAGELRKWADAELNGRKFYISFFAYDKTKDAPVKKEDGNWVPIDPSVVLSDNLCIRLAYIDIEHYAYDDPRQPDEVREMGEKWRAVCKRFWFWGYDAVYADYCAYNSSIGAAAGTVKFLRALGTEYVFMQAAHDAENDWQSQWKAYVWTKLLWNPDLDAKALSEEYLDGYYGAAAPYVRRVIDLFEARYSAVYDALPAGDMRYDLYHAVDDVPGNIDEGLLTDARAEIERGEAAVRANKALGAKEKEKLLLRLARVKVTPVWMRLKRFKDFHPEAGDGERTRLAEEFAALARYAGITRIRENRSVWDELKEVYGCTPPETGEAK